jgi:hypothetical protein
MKKKIKNKKSAEKSKATCLLLFLSFFFGFFSPSLKLTKMKKKIKNKKSAEKSKATCLLLFFWTR